MKKLTDKQLETRIRNLTIKHENAMIVVVDILREVETRKLYLRQGYPNLLEYCIEELKYSEEEAQEKIDAVMAVAPRTFGE